MKKKLSLAWIAALLCGALVLLPIACTVFYFSHTVSAQLQNTARQTVSFYMDQLAGQTDAVLNTLRGSIYYLMSDGNTKRIMRRDGMPGQLELLAIEEGLSRAFFLGGQLDQSVVTGIYLVKNDREYLSVLRSGIFSGTAHRVLQVYEKYGALNSARDLYLDPDQPGYCYFIVDYLDLETMRVLGKIIIELNADELVNASYLQAIYPEGSVLLRGTDGRLLTGARAPAFQELPAHAPAGYLALGGETYYHANRSLSPLRLQLDIFVPRHEIFETIHSALQVYLFFTLLLLLATLLGGAFAVYLLYQPLRQMLHKIDHVATGDLTVRMGETPYRETERMSAAFNHMADRLEELFDEVYHKGLLLREAEFNLLESQIQPHFIFNVLELINMRCMEAGQPGICQTVSNLAQLIRANITHKHEQTVPLQEELRYARYYLALQKERFEDQLNYHIEVEDPALLRCYLPKLTLQPLVENSLVHGLENKRGGGTVQIGVWEEEDAFCIRVSDDGVGFDVSALKLDCPDAPGPGQPHNHVALRNISRRIQLLYGVPYGMHVTSAPGAGTTVMLTLPITTDRTGERGDPDAENHDSR